MNINDIKIEYTYGEPKDQTLDIFYCDGYGSGPVAKVSYKDIAIHIYCDGEMDFTHNGIRVRNNSRLEEAGIFNDSDAAKINSNQWMNNPWFDAYLESDNGLEHLDMVTGDINEAVNQAKKWLIKEALV